MAQRAGARLALLDQVWWQAGGGQQPGQIAVNRAGRRFCNESLGYDFGKALAYFDPHTYQFANLPAYTISNRPLALSDTDIDNLGKQVENVDGASAPSLRELAAKIGVNADNLEATVVEFDRNAVKGVDPVFGRGDSAWDRWRKLDKTLINPCIAPLGTAGPFHAQRIVPRLFGTKGGPVIDDHARIVDFDGTPIPGLIDDYVEGGRARVIGRIGAVGVIAGTALLVVAGAGVGADTSVAGMPLLMVLGAAVSGLGNGTFTTASNASVATSVPVSRRAEAIGYFGLTISIGQAVGAGTGYSLFQVEFAAPFVAAIALMVVGTAVWPRASVISTLSDAAEGAAFDPRMLGPSVARFLYVVRPWSHLAVVA